ncbi:Zinc finger protein [Wickerhamomyces ciferrii]|uniref:Zinc finger protein n=1 Tax=Wickerhamomyces ciferrii (strain ATCC 14091 / BCRC 22168 / CBS 111 / JCM 3599 / NBRC 0793 / NRRL Y-1031 F-60-10) TaxID=1206466 RepID=K0K981_WICCF|nr:Zinc finger protein [Wickerhamomyces ciferrii]CCH41455.1 Zinc finger protein [Wickerhamomyces ciferrii]
MKRNSFTQDIDSKRPKLEEEDVNMSADQEQQKKEDFFAPVGEAAEEVDQSREFNDEGIRQTGAQDAEGHPVQEIQSLCMNCHENGITRLLLTRIPYFREVIIVSFNCDHCGFKNSEIQPASSIQEKGSKYVLKIENKEDFNRQVVKSETASSKFVELDFEIPPKRGQLTNIEGLLTEMISDLEADQPARKEVDETLHNKIDEFIQKIKSTLNGDEGRLPITFELDDPAGNSWIEFIPNEAAHKWSHSEYIRSDEQNVLIGIITQDQLDDIRIKRAQELAANKDRNPTSTGFISDQTDIENFENEVQTFAATCPTCYVPCETHMKVVNIPHFKDVIIMSTVCQSCGYKSNEVKTGGAIPEKGRRITLHIEEPEDLARDILKSESCGLSIPELNLELNPGTLGGRFTTIEGLLTQVLEELHGRVFTETSDSMDETAKSRWTGFFENLQEAIDGKKKFTVKMEDPLAGSYIQNVYAPDDDPNMEIEDYERTFEQNEDLGLNDMKV